jgi:two-component system catabolic regulation response regulator CreB
MAAVLVVEDEPGVADAVAWALRRDGLAVTVCATLAAARAAGTGFDLAVLDLGLPDGSGLDLLRAWRGGAPCSPLPVIVLSARDGEVDRVVGLELGADDYLVKPFSPRELVARVRAVLRRAHPAPAPVPAEGLVIDTDGRRASWRGRALDLTRYEFRLLACLAERPGRVFSRAELLDLVWEDPGARFDRTVDTHIKTLRAKLRAIDPGRDPLATLRGEGYAWCDGDG